MCEVASCKWRVSSRTARPCGPWFRAPRRGCGPGACPERAMSAAAKSWSSLAGHPRRRWTRWDGGGAEHDAPVMVVDGGPDALGDGGDRLRCWEPASPSRTTNSSPAQRATRSSLRHSRRSSRAISRKAASPAACPGVVVDVLEPVDVHQHQPRHLALEAVPPTAAGRCVPARAVWPARSADPGRRPSWAAMASFCACTARRRCSSAARAPPAASRWRSGSRHAAPQRGGLADLVVHGGADVGRSRRTAAATSCR